MQQNIRARRSSWAPLKGHWIFHRQRIETTVAATLCALGIAALSGCASINGYQRTPESSAVIQARRISYYGLHADDAYYAASANSRQAIRDELVYGKMQVLEDDFLEFERSLNSAGNYVSLGSDLTVLVLNGVAATTGGATTKSALAAASAGIVGAQGAVNKDLYYQKTLSAIISQMQANRDKARLTIIQNLKQPDSSYPLNSAEIDLKRLEEAGSLVNAVNDITQQATTQKNGTDAQIQQLQTLTSANTSSATKLQAWLYPHGRVDQVHYDALQAWLNKQPESFLKGQNYPPAAFVSGDTSGGDLEPIRQRALSDPTLNIPH
ncbi:MAG TPA: hypothetical protein VGR92_04350 [Steroidobacteraceae bacterium]|nr:hypothetical protein [Steroidobacteraceae bacterium]